MTWLILFDGINFNENSFKNCKKTFKQFLLTFRNILHKTLKNV